MRRAAPTDWTLIAAGPTPTCGISGISGITGTPAVTPATLNAGTLTGARLVVPNGGEVTCTINYNDVPGIWTINKESNPASESAVKPGDVITYTVTAATLTGTDPQNVRAPATTGTVAVAGTSRTWTIPVLSGDRTVTYQVKANADANGVILVNQEGRYPRGQGRYGNLDVSGQAPLRRVRGFGHHRSHPRARRWLRQFVHYQPTDAAEGDAAAGRPPPVNPRPTPSCHHRIERGLLPGPRWAARRARCGGPMVRPSPAALFRGVLSTAGPTQSWVNHGTDDGQQRLRTAHLALSSGVPGKYCPSLVPPVAATSPLPFAAIKT